MKILFIPGLLCTKEVWGRLNKLREKFDCLDADVVSFSSIREMSESASSQVKDEDIDSIIGIGISMGGYVLLDMAIRNIEQLRSIILINTTSSAVTEESVPDRLRMIELAESNNFKTVLDESKGYCFFKPTAETNKLEERMGLEIGAEAYVRQQKAIISRNDLTGKLCNVKAPSMVITGKNDNVLPISDSYNMFALLGRSKLVAYSECGHLSTLESESIYDDVLSFIGQ